MASSRVIQSTGADGLTTGQRNQLATDRQIRAERENKDAVNKLAQINAQNQGQQNVAFLNNTGAMVRENVSQAGATQRQGMADNSAMAVTKLRETAETGRNTASNTAAMDRLSKGHGFAMEQATQKDKFDTAGDHRKAAAAALVAGAPGAQINSAMNANHGFPVDYSGVQVPLKNTQQDQFQFITKDNQAGQAQSVMVGNKQTGQLVEAPAVSALSSGVQQQQSPAATVVGKPAAPDAYAKIYQGNPQRLQEDVASAAAQIGTVYKTDEEQLAYLNATRKTNPMLFQALKQHLVQQQAVAR